MPSRKSAPRRRIQIIGGHWRGTLLQVPDAAGLRPTPARARETLFNWLGQHLDGLLCLDAFAGTGILGLEALSRGASQAVFVETDRDACFSIQKQAAKLGAQAKIRLHNGDFFQKHWIPNSFDVVFLDPPFSLQRCPDTATALLLQIMGRIGSSLKPDGLVYWESRWPMQPLPGWYTWKENRVGQVHYHLLRRPDAS